MFHHLGIELKKALQKDNDNVLLRLFHGEFVTPLELDTFVNIKFQKLLIQEQLIYKFRSGYLSPFRLHTIGKMIFLTDPELPEDLRSTHYIAPPWESKFIAQFLPTEPQNRVLNVGCGSGCLALLLAPYSNEIIAVDINSRALSLAKLNANMNGISNIKFHLSSLLNEVNGPFSYVVFNSPTDNEEEYFGLLQSGENILKDFFSQIHEKITSPTKILMNMAFYLNSHDNEIENKLYDLCRKQLMGKFLVVLKRQFKNNTSWIRGLLLTNLLPGRIEVINDPQQLIPL